MVISPLAPDQTIAQMWSSGARWLEMSLFLILSPSPIWAPLQLSRERQPNRQQTTRLQSISDLKRHIFFPVAIETAGSWSQQAIEQVQEIGRCTTVITEDTTFLFQRLSVALQRGNAVSFLGTFPQDYSVVAVMYTFC